MYVINAPDKGRCVMATKSYKRGDTVEVCYYIRISLSEKKILEGTIISDYRFDSTNGPVLLLGNGSLYNHHPKPNLDTTEDNAGNIGMVANQDIEPGDELTIDYGYKVKFKVMPQLRIEGIMRDGKLIPPGNLFTNNQN